MRHQYTREELESITQETAIYIEGAGIAQLQWGGLEIAEGVKDGYLYCKHIKPFSLELYGQYWTAFDGPPERGKNNERHFVERSLCRQKRHCCHAYQPICFGLWFFISA